MNPEAEYREIARLVGLAEAIAELAAEQGHQELRRFARNAVDGFQHVVTPADPTRRALYRHEAGELLRDAFGDTTTPCLTKTSQPATGYPASVPPPRPGR